MMLGKLFNPTLEPARDHASQVLNALPPHGPVVR
jgi:hypothetical protein